MDMHRSTIGDTLMTLETTPDADIETQRLVMRRHRPEDFADCAALWGDEDVMRFITGRALGEEESWTRFLRFFGHWDVMGFGYWVVHEKTSGRFVGSIGFADYRRAIEPPLGGAPELGWMVATAAQGQGFATEAVQAATLWGDRHFGRRATVCIIVPRHLRSIKVAEKVGYSKSHPAFYKDHETIVFTRPGPGNG